MQTGGKTKEIVRLSDDEIVVREYHVVTWGLIRRTKGFVTITNKRLIFFSARGTKSNDVNDVGIQSVNGVDFEIGPRDIISILLGILLPPAYYVAVSVIIASSGSGSLFLPIAGSIFGIILIAAVLLILKGIRRRFRFTFKANEFSHPFVIQTSVIPGLPSSWFRRRQSATYGGIFLRLTRESEVMAREVGAVVNDVRFTGTTTLTPLGLTDQHPTSTQLPRGSPTSLASSVSRETSQCPSCGSEVSLSAMSFCPKCGSRLGNSS